jgi:hypothetical protein
LQIPERILEEIQDDSASAGEEVKQDDKLSRKKYDFLYRRTCFRLMTDFFKTQFNNLHKGKKVSRDYKRYLLEYAQYAFRDLNQTPEFIATLNTVVNPHRHSKVSEDLVSNESSMSYISTDSKEFSTVRDVMYKYSKNAQERFMGTVDLVFLFIWFQ